MEAYLLEWLNLLGRWAHIIVGIAWIGASFYFVWLDNHLLSPADPKARERGVAGELWAVHGGGFYHSQKYRVAPAQLPAHLHWFYWEAYSTWLTGFFMLCVIYYGAPTLYLIDPSVMALAPWQAIAIGLGTLVGGWLIYDGLCRSPLGRDDRVLGAVLAVLLCLAAWGLCSVFSGRGAYIHFGALLGTMMVANVFFVIIPGQRRSVAAMREGRDPDPRDGLRGKQRSVHNTYFTLPVLFTMISNHYATTWGSPHKVAALIGLTFAGAAIRAWFVLRHKAHERGGKTPIWSMLIGLAAIVVVVIVLRPASPTSAPISAAPAAGDASAASTGEPTAATPTLAAVQQIVEQRCVLCHAQHPKFAGFTAPPKGIALETADELRTNAALIRQQLASRAMPLGNITQMTDTERQTVLDWIAHQGQGASP
ncbi:urate hydroxylase PuuD [Solimonas marina]|uniref:Urate hydroxylase PuuD n=1 Tax=Solimonas marina TaxID=2714601 RepID=A0A969WGG4_9GAMM|nr:urate hydroxylase PuuD [Solimonas marina]NKF24240.1 urate hydroxylase PuuD [Solimonas marina]